MAPAHRRVYPEYGYTRDELFDRANLFAAREYGKLHTCPRGSVGAVLVINGRIAGIGWNSSLDGESYCIDDGCVVENGVCTRVRHAEENAYRSVFTTLEYKKNFDLYCTLQPCPTCMAEWILPNYTQRIILPRRYVHRDERYEKALGFKGFIDTCEHYGIEVTMLDVW